MDGIAEGSQEFDFDDEESWKSGSSATSFGENEDDVGLIHYPHIGCLWNFFTSSPSGGFRV